MAVVTSQTDTITQNCALGQPPAEMSDAVKRSMNSVSKIEFERIVIHKHEELKGLDLRGALVVTRDDHFGTFLHFLIYIAQIFNAIIFGVTPDDMNYCHAEIIVGVKEKVNRIMKAQMSDVTSTHLVLAHALVDGIRTTAEDYKIDHYITHLVIFRPVDKKIRELFAKFAEQTTLAKEKEAQLKLAKSDATQLGEIPYAKFSFNKMILSTFHNPQPRICDEYKTKMAFAAADLLMEGLLKDPYGNVSTESCSGYMLTLVQASSIIAQLTPEEKENLALLKDRNAIAEAILEKINAEDEHAIKRMYLDNPFMKLNPSHTMPYMAGRTLSNQSSHIDLATARNSWVADAG